MSRGTVIVTDNHLLRRTTADYADGLSLMQQGTSAAEIARVVFDQTGDMPNDAGLASIFTFWGQFIDHDLSLTPDASGEIVRVPGLVAPLERSVYDPATGTDGPREHINVVTAAMDASMVYGSDAAVTAALRAFSGGRMAVEGDDMMPLTDSGMAGATPDKLLYFAGDVRANENPALTALHLIFVREHNHWADRLAALHPDWTDEALFVAARSIVEAEIQKITYDDWLPHLVGNAMGAATGHDPAADGRIATEFSTAGFRFGHTMVSPVLPQIEENGQTAAQGDLRVQDAFFSNTVIANHGVDDLLRGLVGSTAQMSDALLIDDINFFLQSPGGVTGFSLAALNILRARDHGLGSYVDVRAQLIGDIDPATLDPTDFSIITTDAATQARLAAVYASVHDVDLWVGGLAEDDIAGTQLGALFTNIVADQFARTRAADVSFGLLDPAIDPAIRAEAAHSTLGDIIQRTTGVEAVQDDVFLAATRRGGTDADERIDGADGADLIIGFGGNDVLCGRGGDDALYGGAGRDRMMGHNGDDVLYGGAGRDVLNGGRGDDRLVGGADNDTMRGDAGSDTFVFALGSGRDTVRDFDYTTDRLELAGFGLTDTAQVSTRVSQVGWDVHLSFGTDTLVLRDIFWWEIDRADIVLV